jgi:hypothetical protein
MHADVAGKGSKRLTLIIMEGSWCDLRMQQQHMMRVSRDIMRHAQETSREKEKKNERAKKKSQPSVSAEPSRSHGTSTPETLPCGLCDTQACSCRSRQTALKRQRETKNKWESSFTRLKKLTHQLLSGKKSDPTLFFRWREHRAGKKKRGKIIFLERTLSTNSTFAPMACIFALFADSV